MVRTVRIQLEQVVASRVCHVHFSFSESIPQLICNLRFASSQMDKRPGESVKSVSSVVYKFERTT